MCGDGMVREGLTEQNHSLVCTGKGGNLTEECIPQHVPSITQAEIDAVVSVLTSKYLTTGPISHSFEKEFAEKVNVKHAMAVSSCTAALELALDAIGLQEGDEIIVPTYTYTATALAVTKFRGVPVLCDSALGQFNIGAAEIAERITAKTKAVIPVHIGGNPCELNEIHALAKNHGLAVIEDAAHAFPSKYRGMPIGGLSDLSCFSFYSTKTLAIGEGGMLTFNDEKYLRRADVMRLHGISGSAWSRGAKWEYDVEAAGFKMNLPDVLSAIGRVQLARADELQQKREAIALTYNTSLGGDSRFDLPPQTPPQNQNSWHLYILRLKDKRVDRKLFVEALDAAGISTRVHYIPLHLHSFYQRTYGYKPGDFPNAEAAFAGAVSLPIWPDMSLEQVRRVIASVKRVLDNFCR
jgi:dTDP-4-amino-4,6-dideoxygalactose transaminase